MKRNFELTDKNFAFLHKECPHKICKTSNSRLADKKGFMLNARHLGSNMKEGYYKLMLTTTKFSEFFVPTPLVGGELYTQLGFIFVQSILADGYIHRREM